MTAHGPMNSRRGATPTRGINSASGCASARTLAWSSPRRRAQRRSSAISSRHRTRWSRAGSRLGRQELDGEVLDDSAGALWRWSWIDAARVTKAPDLRRIVVAVDPATTSGEESDETGIVVAGIGYDGRGYVLADESGRYRPEEWARRVASAYAAHKADAVIAEGNQGGEMVAAVLRAYGSAGLPVRTVHARRGKATRAEPVAVLYEQGRVSHVGSLARLEDQITTWDPASSRASPDRLDALVYALTDLLGGPTVTTAPPRLVRTTDTTRAW